MKVSIHSQHSAIDIEAFLGPSLIRWNMIALMLLNFVCRFTNVVSYSYHAYVAAFCECHYTEYDMSDNISFSLGNLE